MASAPINKGFKGLFNNLSTQEEEFKGLISKSDRYYAFLSKVEFVGEKKYDLFFEMMNYEWAELVLFSSTEVVDTFPPEIPVIVYHMRDMDETAILNVLQLDSPGNLAAGSWYLIELEKGQAGKLFGDLYNPDIDFLPYTED